MPIGVGAQWYRLRGSGTTRRGFGRRDTLLGAGGSRPIVAGLIASNFERIASLSFRCLLRSRSSAGAKTGRSVLKRLPQTRSDVSHNAIGAARAASSYNDAGPRA